MRASIFSPLAYGIIDGEVGLGEMDGDGDPEGPRGLGDVEGLAWGLVWH